MSTVVHPRLRQVVIGHGILAFVFNTVILALVVNIRQPLITDGAPAGHPAPTRALDSRASATATLTA